MCRSAALVVCTVFLMAALASRSSAQSDVYDFLDTTSDVGKFFRALQAVPTLLKKAENPNAALTFFVPTDEAFAHAMHKLNTTLATLQKNATAMLNLLEYHIATNALMVSIAATPRQMKVKTLLTGAYLTLQLIKNNITIAGASNRANVISPDFPAGNAYVQIIDEVLLPPMFKARKSRRLF